MKPFIHLFETPKNYYFYDVNRNENVQVSQKVYGYLERVLNDDVREEGKDLDIEKEIRMLKENGYLSDNQVKEIKHLGTDLLPLYLARKMNILTIQLTQNCNLRCSYCAYTSNNGTNRLHQNKKVDLNIAKKAILMLRDNSIDSNKLSIGFYGGEPLLEFDLIKEIVRFCKKELIGREVNYTITTNSTLLSDEILEFFERENFQIVLSLDGPKKINDKNRKFLQGNDSVYDKVIKNIKKIEKEYKKLFKNLTINMVIDPTQNFNDYQELFIQNPLLNKVKIMATLVDNDYKEVEYTATELFNKQYGENRYKYYLYYLGKIELENKKFFSALFQQNYKELLGGHRRAYSLGKTACPSGPCIPGKQRLMVDVNGMFYPCERISETDENNIIGNIDRGIELNKSIEVMNIARQNEEECKKCFAFRYCGLCIKAYEEGKVQDQRLKNKCQSTRNGFHNHLMEMEFIRETSDLA